MKEEVILLKEGCLEKLRPVMTKLKWELQNGTRHRVIVKPYVRGRSLDANAYFHVLVGKIAEVMRMGADEIKVKMNLEYGTQHEQTVILPEPNKICAFWKYAKEIDNWTGKDGKEYTQYLIYKDTSSLNSSEMARLIEGVVYEAKELGIETLTPSELAKLNDNWRARNG